MNDTTAKKLPTMITEPNFLWYEPVSDTYWKQKPADVSGYTKYIRADLVEQYKAAIKDRLEEAYEAEREGKYLADDILEILEILNGEADDA